MKNENHENNFGPEDPRLTAYALGELEGEERTEIEARLAHDAQARATVAAVQALAGEMSAALAAEPAPEASSATESLARAAIIPGSHRHLLDGGAFESRGKLIRFPQFYYVISGLAAACFVAFVATRPPEVPKAKPKTYTEITLNPIGMPAVPTESETPASVAAGGVGGLATELATTSVLSNGILPLPLFEDRMSPVVFRSEPVGKLAAQVMTFSAAPRSVQPPVFTMLAQSTGRENARDAFSAATAYGRVSDRGLGVAMPRRGPLLAFSGAFSGAPFGEVRASPMLLREITKSLRTKSDETYAYVRDNDFLAAAQNPLSTFSLDVDTASYANVRRFLRDGMRPPADAVRIEELVNYFPYAYPEPAASSAVTGEPAPVIAAALEVADAPWAAGHRLVRIALKARDVTLAARPPANLVFLIDVSGSMSPGNRLPLVKEALHLLVDKLRPDDRVAIVTYAGNSGLALPSTPAAQAREIVTALDNLTAGGSTNGEMGIHLAYDIAKANFVSGGVNRVILCTDGDFNVGATNADELTKLVTEKAKSGVFLTTLGFGMGNYKDAMLEKLADNGNGNYGYIDTRREAEKLLVSQINSTLVTVAKDVKVQVDFNPARVASYRLIGFENRLLKKEDFNDDQVDAGEVGAGHTVTALYEIVPVGAEVNASAVRSLEESKYTQVAARSAAGNAASNELLTVRVRYKEPAGDVSRKLEFPLTDGGAAFAAATPDFKFAAAVASFGMILRNSPHKGGATLDQVVAWAMAGIANDAGGWRSEFLELARLAKAL